MRLTNTSLTARFLAKCPILVRSLEKPAISTVRSRGRLAGTCTGLSLEDYYKSFEMPDCAPSDLVEPGGSQDDGIDQATNIIRKTLKCI